MSRVRVVLYSPGMVGLGHMRRNLLIAQALASARLSSSILLVAEAREASAMPMPPGVDCLTLPAVQKRADGNCHARHLDLPLDELIALRSRTIAAALEGFEPDLVIADHLPYGTHGELRPALESLGRSGRTRFVLGLRDILDDPATVRREWRERGYDEAIEAFFDAVWVYGDPLVFDPVTEYSLPSSVTRLIRFSGYLDTRVRLRASAQGEHLLAALGLGDRPLAVCLVGGGTDGERIAEAFARMALPADTSGVIVTGPFMPADARRRLYGLAARHGRMHVLDFVVEPAFLVRRADWMVTMGGYNSTCDVLAFGKRALVVPRARPRCEQRMRAERLRDLGLVDVLLPEHVSHDAFEAWSQRPSAGPADPSRRVDLDGLARLPGFAEDVLRRRQVPLDAPALRVG